MSTIRTAVITLRSTTARQRAARSERRHLAHALAEYRTEAERQDLYAILSRHTPEQAAPITRILDRQSRSAALVHHG
jgi:hypothetical protein